MDTFRMTRTPLLNLIVLRSTEPAKSVAFYQLLGIGFEQEQHGTGPAHWAAEIGGLVLEVYPAKSAEEVCRSTRLGFEVDNIGSLVERLRSAGAVIVNDVKPSQWGLRVVARDPDGRSVELVQRG